MPVPEGVPDPDASRLDPEGRPRVFRTFLPEAGARGIAVGLPIGLHYAFDAERCFVTDVWRGEFLTTGLPVKLSATPGAIERPPPLHGEHDAEVLRECGLSDDEIDGLRERGVVGAVAPRR